MAIGTRRFFSDKGRHLSALNFRWVHLSVFKFFLFKFLRFCENLLLVFERTGDHKIPAKKLGFQIA